LLAGSYGQVCELVRDFAKGLDDESLAKVFGGNAARFYGIE